MRVPPDAWDFRRLPPHLRMTFRVEDERRGVLAEGDDLADVRAQVRPLLRAELTAAASRLERTRPDLVGRPRVAPARGDAAAAPARRCARYPALVDEGATVGVRVLETPAAQRAAMRAGHAAAAAADRPLPREVRARTGSGTPRSSP